MWPMLFLGCAAAAAQESLHIHAYRGFGTPDRLHAFGRITADPVPPATSGRGGRVRNAIGMARAFESDEVAGVPVGGTAHGAQAGATSDEEGYFEVQLDAAADRPFPAGWVDVTVSAQKNGARATAVCAVLVVPPGTPHAVVSDIDDTLLQTQSNSLWRMLRTVLLSDARSRKAVEGAAAFVAAQREDANTPVFYLSSSPWNLYGHLAAALEHHGFPKGVIFLRDFGVDRNRLIAGSHESHKAAWLERLFAAYPDTAFTLIGDTAQDDPAIYAETAKQHPGRVRAIYIRQVEGGDTAKGIAALQAVPPDVAVQVVASYGELAE